MERFATNSKRKYKYLEKVIVQPSEDNMKDEIAGRQGTILGYDFFENQWFYQVDIEGAMMLYSLREDELTSTGHFDKENKFYPESR